MIWTLDWYPLMNTSLHTRQNLDDKSVRFQSDSFFLLTTWKHVISSCKVYSISTMRTLTGESIKFCNFILIASIHLWSQYIENFMSSSPLGCDFVTSLILRTSRSRSVEWKSELPQLSSEPRYFFQSRSYFFWNTLNLGARACYSFFINTQNCIHRPNFGEFRWKCLEHEQSEIWNSLSLTSSFPDITIKANICISS